MFWSVCLVFAMVIITFVNPQQFLNCQFPKYRSHYRSMPIYSNPFTDLKQIKVHLSHISNLKYILMQK